ncbi:hypothetical protein [Hyphomicrobium sp. CS1GBMeth3]|uniref:hypothetical protein n=1 Tax=Hyphomicrobium sp. CS1GBMeth3 TaxID=1892845 RepID=UPI0009312ECF|nr:hypothetical protein [Hyphomicrobium sp. CS1GBMeth3]
MTARVVRGGPFRLALLSAAMAAALTGGCASGGGPGGPSKKALANGESCGSIKQQLNKLDARGVPASVQAQAAGKKISGQQKADADLYNQLLNDYLGARCHV